MYPAAFEYLKPSSIGEAVALLQQHVVNLLPLRRQAQPRRAQLFSQVLLARMMVVRLHFPTIYRTETPSQDLE